MLTTGSNRLDAVDRIKVLWIFDYILTLPTEIRAIWFRKWTGVSVLFLLNRYVMMASVVSLLVLSTPGPSSDEG